MGQHKENSRHRQAFEVWYGIDRDFRITSQNLATNERTVRDWADRFGWHELADRRDMEASAKSERDAIARKVKLLEDQRKAGETLRNVGVGYFDHYKEASITKARDAITAVKEGFALERQAEGLPDWVGTIINASDNDLYALEQALARGEAAAVTSGEDGEGPPRIAAHSNGARSKAAS